MTHYSKLSKVVIDVPVVGYDCELTFWSGAVDPAAEPVRQLSEYHRTALHSRICCRSSSNSDTARPRCTSPPTSPQK